MKLVAERPVSSRSVGSTTSSLQGELFHKFAFLCNFQQVYSFNASKSTARSRIKAAGLPSKYCGLRMTFSRCAAKGLGFIFFPYFRTLRAAHSVKVTKIKQNRALFGQCAFKLQRCVLNKWRRELRPLRRGDLPCRCGTPVQYFFCFRIQKFGAILMLTTSRK